MSELGPTYGAAYIGVQLILYRLYGVTHLQVFVYFREYHRDTLWNKLVVCWLWALDSLHLAFCVYMLYWYLITSYGNVFKLQEVHWSFQAETIMTAMVVICVHALYTIRVWHLEATVREHNGWHRFRPISSVIIIAFLAGLTAVFVLCYDIVRVKSLITAFQPSELWRITYYPLATAAFVDTLIAAALCYLLSRCRTGTDTVITWLMFYTLNTGMVTTICTLTSIILLAVFRGKFYFITVEFIMVKLYINSYLAMLNARSSLLNTKDRVPEQAIQPICIVCRSRPAGEARLTKVDFVPMANSSMTESRPEADFGGSVAKIDLRFSGVQDSFDTVPSHSSDPGGWPTAPVGSAHSKV
ncbi:hypothetical protein FOMPIDRAFT_1051898 [Fomitopsis schrenkii]|uniref:DUF6534 domain-containing protein n=1 Tax=Fomitopsis schrenkii TaxID=2126942 RepID=S8DZM0_FOMSC|nr:hypothetical protein FOMPIDRAFT_1051898 [Fomitopsis schrenkii]